MYAYIWCILYKHDLTNGFDYDITDQSLLIIAGYNLYNLNLSNGLLNWTYTYNENIWSVCSINDITEDEVNDLVISVQPSDVITIDGKLGTMIWQKTIASDYEVKKEDKLVSKVKRNIWDLHFNNNLIVASGEDGYLYHLNSMDGTINNKVQIIENIPTILANTVYVPNNKAIKYSGLGNNGVSTYKIIQTRIIQDITGDKNNDLLVTIYEDNPYATYSLFSAKLILLDGKSLTVLSERELPINRSITDLKISHDNRLSFFDSDQFYLIDLNIGDLNIVSEVDLISDENSNDHDNQSFTSFLYENSLFIKTEDFYQFDISNLNSPVLQNTIYLLNEFEMIIKDQELYKLYYKEDINHTKTNNYYVIQNLDIETNEIIWEHAIDDLSFSNQTGFKQYVMTNMDEDNSHEIVYFNENRELVRLDFDVELEITTITHDLIPNSTEQPDFEIKEFSSYRDLNSDGILELLILTNRGDFIILNGDNLNEVLQHNYLNSNYDYEETPIASEMYDTMYPNFNEDSHFVYLINNKSFNRVTLDASFNILNEEKTDLLDFNFWYDPSSVLHQQDYDGDGINDYVLRLNNNNGGDEQLAAILYSSVSQIGFLRVGWDFSLYSTHEDLNEDGLFDMILMTSLPSANKTPIPIVFLPLSSNIFEFFSEVMLTSFPFKYTLYNVGVNVSSLILLQFIVLWDCLNTSPFFRF